jgi:GNAT superfamily N-acetyltransferase
LPPYRGRGLGHAFFDHREAQARRHGAMATTFCGVVRPADHPARPADHVPLDRFWQKRGYAMVPGLIAHFSWQDIGDDHETEKPMQYWMRHL